MGRDGKEEAGTEKGKKRLEGASERSSGAKVVSAT